MNLFAPNLTDGYKTGHPAQYAEGTDFVSSNFTPRDFGYAITTPATKTDKMVFVGLQYACKEYLINQWNTTFFQKPKEEVIKKFARRIKNYLGTGQGVAALDMMDRLHDLGYLPIKIKALPEGSRVNAGIPVFTVQNTIAGFGPLTNYLETVLSDIVWPMCNSASLMEQYYLLAKDYGNKTGASPDFWLPFAIHNFAMRGHRGVEDAIISAFGHSLFHAGTDTFSVIDFAEDYYNADSDKELIGCSVNASEHATVCQQIAVHGGGHEGEKAALKHFLTNVYPTGVFSYVSDSRDYWDVISVIAKDLKDVIMSRGPNADGQPGVLTFRPDSSVDTPYEVLCGYKVLEVVGDLDDIDAIEFADEGYTAIHYTNGGYFAAKATMENCDLGCCENWEIVQGREMSEAEAKGTIQTLWDIFGGAEIEGGVESSTSCQRMYKLLDSHVRVIYGEAISLEMARKIYQGLMDKGFSVGNVLFGVGSWAFIGNSSRDSYGLAMKATNSVVNGVDYALQKDPRGTSSFKKSAKGRLRVEFMQIEDKYVLFDEQSELQEDMGELKDFFVDSVIVNEQVFADMKEMLRK
jgi:nicotinamide phosphoribosyltransferase